jgi:hypothetical protein
MFCSGTFLIADRQARSRAHLIFLLVPWCANVSLIFVKMHAHRWLAIKIANNFGLVRNVAPDVLGLKVYGKDHRRAARSGRPARCVNTRQIRR